MKSKSRIESNCELSESLSLFRTHSVVVPVVSEVCLCVCIQYLTRGGMCPLCICPLVMCCLACGMEPIWKLSGPPAPERMMAGRATEPVSTFPTLLNCCWRTVDLEHNTSQVPISANAVTQTYNRKWCVTYVSTWTNTILLSNTLVRNELWKDAHFLGDTESSNMVDSSSPSWPKWSLLFFCR